MLAFPGKLLPSLIRQTHPQNQNVLIDLNSPCKYIPNCLQIDTDKLFWKLHLLYSDYILGFICYICTIMLLYGILGYY